MFQPHSLLWHYLWIAPNLLLLLLAVIFHRRSLHRKLAVFLVFIVVQSVTALALYIVDVMPSTFSDLFWWRANWVRLLIEVVLKFALIGEIFASVFKPYPAVSKLGRNMIRGVGAALVLAATVAAAFAPAGRAAGIIAGSNLLDLADFIIECGLLAFIFLFAAYFRLAWDRLAFGIAMGRGIAASVQLGTWALLANLEISAHGRNLFNFLNMATYHLSVLIWFYYVLTTKAAPSNLPREDADDDHQDHAHQGEDERQHDLDVWNRELERLLQ